MNWEPAHADHSIDNVNILMTFIEKIDLDTFDDIMLPVRKAAATHHFGNRVEVQEPDLELAQPQQMIGGGGLNLTVHFGAEPGLSRRVVFQRIADGAVAAEFSIGAKTLAVATTRYRRWSDLFDITTDILESIENVWPIKSKIKAIRLQFMDRFVSGVGGGDHFEVIARDTRFLVEPIDDPEAAFHVHSGWFDYKAEPSIRALINVNIDANDTRTPAAPDNRRQITILTLSQYESLDSVLDDPLRRLDTLHLRLKDLFSNIISPEAAQRVGLTG